ncbi:ATP-binding protein [Streptomyces sp. Je 1-79]|uniref:ATP-binding protein n=1 Tax=Streptomyces sp. Je 1-79 TaxID=2943847 RepID=UPI0021A52C44|nr:ATP-binding protein [Streptomyces sp. Je 1-79]MCT4351871.1 ATP-binding protein [Streptomyces sp. Je 1-79]
MTTIAPPPTTTRHVVALPCGLQSPAVARRITARWLESTGQDARTSDAVLIVSELVTNAVRHTDGPCVLTLTALGPSLDMAVTDHSEEIPDLHRRAGGDQRGGFGLEIMRCLGGRIKVVPRLGGKTVHVTLQVGAPATDQQYARS